jgi:hypothetical protein
VTDGHRAPGWLVLTAIVHATPTAGLLESAARIAGGYLAAPPAG